jgi:hydroxymethylbilane synthase
MRIGTRGSALALAQARLVASLLGDAEIVSTPRASHAGTGLSEHTLDSTAAANDKSRWVRDLERELLAGRIDLAVHSAKDVPEELPSGLALLGAPARGPVEDVLCVAQQTATPRRSPSPQHAGEPNGARPLATLELGARVGTSSLRRAAQLLAAREDLEVVPIVGNVDTRLHKLREHADALDAIALARAGLQRLGREDEISAVLDPERFVPAPGQGTLALEGRAGDEHTRALARSISDAQSFACLLAEREVSRALGSSCHTPIGAYARIRDDEADGGGADGGGADGGGADGGGADGGGAMCLRAWVGLPDGSQWASDELMGDASDPEALGSAVALRMQAVGAGGLLRTAEEMVLARG